MQQKIAIIGGGPGGYVAAVTAAKRGAKVTLIEQNELGGTCLNRGCIPSKIMKASAELLKKIEKASDFGIDLNQKATCNMAKVMQRKKSILETQQKAIARLLEDNKINYIRGAAYIEKEKKLRVSAPDGSEEIHEWDKLIIASGSKPSSIPSAPFDHKKIISSDDLLNISEIPESIAIVGAGVIGCEFACILSAFGAKVTIIEALDRVLPLDNVDRSCSKILTREMKKIKIKIILEKTVQHVETNDNMTTVKTNLTSFGKDKDDKNETIESEKILICTGRKPETDFSGLKNIGVETDEKGWIIVNEHMETNVKNIYAIGDILGPSKIMLAHVASAEGVVAAKNATGGDKKMNYDIIPSSIFTMPEVASVGLSEHIAKEKGLDVSSASFLFRSIGKAHVIGEIEGEAKIVYESGSRKILGVHITGPHATDLIAEGTLAIKKGVSVKELAETIHAHPTLAEIMYEVSHQALG